MSCLFFFFKQKTAYEMRISDWSSDVCSSDLGAGHAADRQVALLLQRVHRHVVVGDVALDVGVGPGCDRVDLHQAPQVAHDDGCLAAGGGLGSAQTAHPRRLALQRSEEHTSELQSLMRISYAVFCLKKKSNR